VDIKILNQLDGLDSLSHKILVLHALFKQVLKLPGNSWEFRLRFPPFLGVDLFSLIFSFTKLCLRIYLRPNLLNVCLGFKFKLLFCILLLQVFKIFIFDSNLLEELVLHLSYLPFILFDFFLLNLLLLQSGGLDHLLQLFQMLLELALLALGTRVFGDGLQFRKKPINILL
jgi:hypothetical protein